MVNVQPAPGPFRLAVDALMAIGRALLFRSPAPQPQATWRLEHTMAWLVALARTLAGDNTFLVPVTFPRFPGRFPSLTAALRREIGLPALPTKTPAQLEAAHRASRLHYLRRVFATQPTGVIVARLARRLGLTPQSAAWPESLVAITQTPAALSGTPRPLAPAWPSVQQEPWPPTFTPPPAASSPSTSAPSPPTGDPSPPATPPPPPPW